MLHGRNNENVSHRTKNLLFLPCNMAALQNLYTVNTFLQLVSQHCSVHCKLKHIVARQVEEKCYQYYRTLKQNDNNSWKDTMLHKRRVDSEVQIGHKLWSNTSNNSNNERIGTSPRRTDAF